MDAITTLLPWFLGVSLLAGACVEGAKEVAARLSWRAFPRSMALLFGAVWALLVPELGAFSAPGSAPERVALGVLAGSQSALVYWLGARVFAAKIGAAASAQMPPRGPEKKAATLAEGSGIKDPGGLT